VLILLYGGVMVPMKGNYGGNRWFGQGYFPRIKKGVPYKVAMKTSR
jgi:hypothetical protein